jgi:hypothetical protein
MDLVEINLTCLIGGNTFIIPYIININELGIKSSFLINTRVNSYAFINIKLT